jgi:hypothetical protein
MYWRDEMSIFKKIKQAIMPEIAVRIYAREDIAPRLRFSGAYNGRLFCGTITFYERADSQRMSTTVTVHTRVDTPGYTDAEEYQICKAVEKEYFMKRSYPWR